MATEHLTPEEYGRQLAEQAPPLSTEQAHAAARIFASVTDDARPDTNAA